ADHLDPFTGSRRRVDLPDGAQPLGTVEAEDLRGAPYLADPLREGLALLPRQLRAPLLRVAVQDVGRPVQDPPSNRGRRGGPPGERVPSRGDRCVDVLVPGQHTLGDDLVGTSGVRIDQSRTGTRAPLSRHQVPNRPHRAGPLRLTRSTHYPGHDGSFLFEEGRMRSSWSTILRDPPITRQ